MSSRYARSLAASAAIAVAPATAFAQQAPAATVVTPAFDFSGVLFGSYNYRIDSAGKAALGGESPNQFSIDRVHLTFRMPAGDNGQIRVTTEVLQNTNPAQNAYYQGWAIRMKFAYLQYTGLKNELGAGSSLVGRIGLVNTVVIDHEENFWPRYLTLTALERNSFFSTSDAGVAGLLTLGDKWGEIYGTIANGTSFTSYEKDRFKDFSARVTLTPFAKLPGTNPLLRTFAITPWGYKGWVGSAFAAGGTGQIGPGTNGAVTSGMTRDRYGVFAGVKDRRLTAAAEWAQRNDESETGANTNAAPRVTTDSSGRLLDAFIIARPLEWVNPAEKSNIGIVARLDHFTPNTSPTASAYAGSTPSYNFWILGTSYDLTDRITLAIDWQKQAGTGFPVPSGTNVRAAPDNSIVFLHFQATF